MQLIKQPNSLLYRAIGCDIRQETADRIWSSSLPPNVIKSADSVQFKHQETGNWNTRIWWGQGCHVDADHKPHAVWSANCSSGRNVWFISSSTCLYVICLSVNKRLYLVSLWHYVSGWFTEYLVPRLEIRNLWLLLDVRILVSRFGCLYGFPDVYLYVLDYFSLWLTAYSLVVWEIPDNLSIWFSY